MNTPTLLYAPLKFQFNAHISGPGNILTVADDLLKNDGQKFLEMMEQLAERRMQREEEAAGDVEDDSDEESDEERDGSEGEEDGEEDGGGSDEDEEDEEDEDEEDVCGHFFPSLAPCPSFPRSF